MDFFSSRSVFMGRGELPTETMPPATMDEPPPANVSGDIDEYSSSPDPEAPIGTVVSLADFSQDIKDEDAEEAQDEQDIPSGNAPVADMGDRDELEEDAPEPRGATSKRGGRKSARKAPEPAKKGAAARNVPAPSTRKRKTTENQSAAPQAKRVAGGRAAAALAQESIAADAMARKRGGSKAASASAVKKAVSNRRSTAKSTKSKGGDDLPVGEWEVEKIIETRVDPRTKRTLYHVKWKGYSADQNTWEPRKNLTNCDAMFEEFDAPKKKATKGATTDTRGRSAATTSTRGGARAGRGGARVGRGRGHVRGRSA